MVLDDSCMSLMGQVKEVSAIPNLYIILSKEGFESAKITHLGGLWVLFEFESLNSMEKFRNNVGIRSLFSTIKSACNSFVSDERIVWVSIEGLPINSWTSNTFSKVASKWGDLVVWEESEENSLFCKHICLKTKIDEIVNESFKIILKGKVHWIRAKELHAWNPNFLSDKDTYNSDDESDASNEKCKFGDNEFENPKDDSDVEKVSESSCMHGNDFAHENAPNAHCEESPHSTDPFNIYDPLQKKNGKSPLPNDSDPTYPPGFTPVIENINKGEVTDYTINHENINKGEGTDSTINQEKSIPKKKQYTSHNMEGSSQQTTSIPIAGGSILKVMDELVKVGQTMGYNMEGCLKNISEIIGAQGDNNVIR